MAFRIGKIFSALGLVFFLVILALAIPRAELLAPEPTYLLLDRNQQFVAEISQDADKGHGYWPLKTLPKRVVEATLAREDRRFWQHYGVDFIAIVRAISQNVRAGRRISGASTIAMQVARLQSQGERSYFNKTIETVTAILLTARYEREEILQHYLRLVPYGNQIYGIGYAAERYFSKTVDDLSWAEIALLAAIPQSPTLNNPLRYSGKIRARSRAEKILLELTHQGLISDPQYQLAVTQLQQFSFPAPQSRPASAMHSIFKLQEMILANKKSLGNYRILTTIDLDLQSELQALSQDFKQRWEVAGANQVALVVLDTGTSEVLAWSGSSDYFDPQQGAIDYIRMPRSSGSTLKPFIYALALANRDISVATLLPDLVTVSHGMSNSDNRFLGPMLPRQALANSRNIPVLNLIRKVGIDNAYQFLQDIGLHDGLLPARHYGAGLAIGAMPVTLESLMQAYGILANDGEFKPLRWFREQAPVASKIVIDRNIARQINLWLSDPQARLPSFPRMGTSEYDFPVAVKTGTSQGYRDAWTVAYSKQYSVGVWVGRSDAKPMRKLGGSASAAQLAQTIMRQLHHTSFATSQLRWQPPEGYESVTLCNFTGKLANNRCNQTTSEWLKPDEIPTLDDSFENLWIDRRNGLLAGQWTPPQQLEQKQFVNLPSIYQFWGKSQGLIASPQAYSPLDNPDPNFNHDLGNESQLAAQNREDIEINILSPRDNLRVSRLPEVPDNLNSLAFHLELSQPVDQVLWYVDNRPYQTTSYPYTLRWLLQPGEHQFQAELPYYGIRSEVVRVRVN